MIRAVRMLAAVLAVMAAGCGSESPAPPSGALGEPDGDRAGVRDVRVLEQHSSALVAWRQEGVTGRVVVHLDAHADLDWLPDETVARIAATLPAEIGTLEADPFALASNPLARFATGNFLYAAARLGILEELVWVVPDGTLETAGAERRLIQDVLVGRMQMVTEEEARSFRSDGGRLRGTLLGVPVTICKLGDLPSFPGPVLLDIDLDYFTVRSALTPIAEASPWILPRDVVGALDERGIRSDLVTISLSTMSGSVPPEARWLGAELRRLLRGDPDRGDDVAAMRLAGAKAEQAGEPAKGVAVYRDLARTREDDATLWYVLGRALEASGQGSEAAAARAKGVKLDPLLAHAELLEAERFWVNGAWQSALDRLDRHREGEPREATAFALRRRASCLLRLGREGEAIEALRSVVAQAPESAEARAELGSILRDRGDDSGAVEHLGAARRLAPDVAAYAFGLGAAHFAAGRVEEGIRETEAAVARRPCYVQARARLAGALPRVGRVEEAGRHLAVALALQPGNPRFRILAEQLRRQGARVP